MLVVVVDEHALISDALMQVALTGDYANLFMLAEDDSVLVAELLLSGAAALPAIDITFNEPFERDIELGMVFEVAVVHRGGICFPLSFHASAGLPGIRGSSRLWKLEAM